MSEARAFAQLGDVGGGLSHVVVAALDGLGLGLVIAHDDGGGALVRFMSTAAERIVGHTFDDMTGRPALDVVAPDDRPRVDRLRLDVLAGKHIDIPVKVTVIRNSGERVPIEVGVSAIPWDGKIAIVLLIHDLSERQRLAERLALADRMSTVGTVAAGVAHEIYNPLTAVLLNLDQVARALPSLSGDPGRLGTLRRAVTDARDSAKRVRTIVQDLRSFTRMDEVGASRVDVRKIIASTVNIANPHIRGRATLREQLSDVPEVLAHEGRLGQVFLNLLVNAAQAIVPGAPDENEITVATRLDGRDRVVVEVADTGNGMAPGILRRAFDPFFTTKPIGVGIGLGLSICHNIITSLGGEIQAESMEGKGSVFRVYLPCNT